MPPLLSDPLPLLAARSIAALVLADVLPGYLLVSLLGLGRSRWERFVMAAVLGGAVSASVYWISLASDTPSVYVILLAAFDLAALWLLRRERPTPSPDGPPRRHLAILLLLFSALAAAYCFTTGFYFRLDREGNFLLDPAFTEDTLFHAALVEGLQHSYPPELFSFAGERAVGYHVGYHLQLAAWQRFFGIDRYDGLYRVGVLWSLALLVLSSYLFGSRILGNSSAALWATALLFGGGLGFLFWGAPGANWWSLVFMDATLVSLFLINPLLPSLPLLFVTLICLDDYLREGGGGDLIGAASGLAALFAVKQLLAAQLLAGIVLGVVLSRASGHGRGRKAAFALTLVSVPILLNVLGGFRQSNTTVTVRLLEIVRYSMETLGRGGWARAIETLERGGGIPEALPAAAAATALWFAGFLGLRLAAFPRLLRDARSREFSLRKSLAVVVLIGFPLTLAVRIAPQDAAGFTRAEALNDAFWFATFSGILLWFWTAEALDSFSAKTAKAGAVLVWTAGALAVFPATVQHFTNKSSLSSEATAFPASAIEAARACRDLSKPGEVFVEPPRRVRPSLVAYLAGRPVVHEAFVAYDYVWTSRLERDFRRHAVAQFWNSEDPAYGSWFLSEFEVRWIYDPSGVLPPDAAAPWATPVFSNDAGTVYQVRELPKIPLEPPASLPIGVRGAPFFGDGWGNPERPPRPRRLLPGMAELYVPWNEAIALELTLDLATPHAAGELTLGKAGAAVHEKQSNATLVFPASEMRRGLNRLELIWRGQEPLPVTGIALAPRFDP
jgi:hypothetical protein